MLNPKDAENFYIHSQEEALSNGFTVDSILDTPSDELDGIEVLDQMAKQVKIDP